MKLLSGIAVFAAAASTASAASAYIKNNCKDTVYLWPVDINRNPSSPTEIAPGGEYSEQYHVLNTGGVSLKLSKNKNKVKITQFEYTLVGGFLWYDGSNVDCRGQECPFYADGIHLETSDPTCPQRTCQPGTDCNGFYINFNDDWNTLSCRPDSDIKMYLCSTGPSASAAKVAAPAPAPAPAPAASPSPEPIPVAAPVPAISAPAAVAPPSAAAAAHAPSVEVQKMEAVHGMPTTFRKIGARETPIAERDLHNHMRRHNHMRV